MEHRVSKGQGPAFGFHRLQRERTKKEMFFWFSFIVPNENKTKKETDSVTDDRTTSIRDGSQIRAERPRHRRALGTTSIAVHRSSPIAEYGPKTQTIWLLDFETTSITTVYKITVERVSFEKDINAGCDKGDDVVGTTIVIGTTMLSRIGSNCAPRFFSLMIGIFELSSSIPE